MATTKTEIREWLERGKAENATHVIVVCDTFDWEDYPVFVSPGENVQTVVKRLRFGTDMQKVMEVYSLSQDLNSQLNEYRAFHLD